MRPRWERCEGQVDDYLGEALGQEFVARTFGADTKAKVVTMTDQIEAAMQKEIEQLDWMSEATKKAGMSLSYRGAQQDRLPGQMAGLFLTEHLPGRLFWQRRALPCLRRGTRLGEGGQDG